MVLTQFIPNVESLERLRRECMRQEENLLKGKCQLCLDGLLLMVPISIEDSRPDLMQCPLALSQDAYLLNLIRKCSRIKIIYPPNRAFKGHIDLSLLESCTVLELVRIPFNQISGTERLRQNVCSLAWSHGNDELINDSSLYLSRHSRREMNENIKSLRIDEIFWDQFGAWPSLQHLCISGSNIALINASTIPITVKSLDLPYNRICHFNNLANYSASNSITNLCIEHNSLEELPKLNPNTFSTLNHLSLRGNLLTTVTGLRNFTSLEYLDLSENCICDMQQVLLEISYLSSTLKTLILKNNPISVKKSLQLHCESILPNLAIFDGKKVKRKANLEVPMLVAPVPERLSTTVDEESEDQALKINPSKERFVVIGDDGTDPDSPGKIIRKTRRTEVKNYFFGGYSGSYGSSSTYLPAMGSQPNAIPNMVTVEIAQPNTGNLDLDPEVIENSENTKIPEVIENSEAEVATSAPEDMGIVIKIEHQQDVEKMQPEEAQTSEWATEDTEENTVFLAEIYCNQADLDKALAAMDADYFFIRIRPHDGLIYEKDCTSGKVLQTLDLKILERYECLNQHLAVKLFFDTCIVSKKERIYRFLDEKSFNYFVDMFLSKYVEYRSLYETAVDISNVPSHSNLSSTNNSGSKFAPPWFYMCLRCGERTHRIITDCAKCGSDLIIRDESFNARISPSQSQSSNIPPPPLNFDPASLSVEESIDSDTVTLDENYFRSNINHYLKLHIEIYLYDKIGDESLKSESVEILFHCLVFDFGKQSFVPGLAVLTANYFFLFHHFKDGSTKKTSAKEKDLVSLMFYCSLATRESLVLSHLPKQIKNIGYWIETKSGRKTKNKRKNSHLLELLMFADAIMGKAFLELLFKFQKACNANSILVKSSITKLVDGTGDDETGPDRLRLVLDNTCRILLEQRLGPFRPEETAVDDTFPGADIFPLDSFRFIQNVNLSMNENLFSMNENIVLIVINDYLIIGELFCSFKMIASALKSSQIGSMAEFLKKCQKFDDYIELKTLFKEWIINLLPNLFIDKNEFLLILRFRDDDATADQSNRSTPPAYHHSKTQKHVLPNEQKSQSDLMIYEFKLQFLSLHSLIQTCRMIRSCWENNFGVSLTFSKYVSD